MIVYRIQDNDGRGPYRLDWQSWKDPGHDERNPSVFDEFGPDITLKLAGIGHVGCGFSTVNQALDWFTEAEWAKLRDAGYRFVSMSVGKIIFKSARQLVFGRRMPLVDGACDIGLYKTERKAP